MDIDTNSAGGEGPTETTASTSENVGGSAAIRSDMVDAAVRFMSGPKVRETPREQQIEFLKTKGLSDAEIELATSRVAATLPTTTTVVASQQQPIGVFAPNAGYQQRNTWRDYANIVVIVAGTSYGFYKLCRQWVLPQYFGIPDPEREAQRRMEEQIVELQNSLKFVMDSVQQTLTAVQRQQDSLDRALALWGEKDRTGAFQYQMQELKTEIGVVKSLLLSRNQFAPLPVANAQPTVPAWQMSAPPRNTSSTSAITSINHRPLSTSSSGYKTPPSGIVDGGVVVENGGRHNDSDSIADEQLDDTPQSVTLNGSLLKDELDNIGQGTLRLNENGTPV